MRRAALCLHTIVDAETERQHGTLVLLAGVGSDGRGTVCGLLGIFLVEGLLALLGMTGVTAVLIGCTALQSKIVL